MIGPRIGSAGTRTASTGASSQAAGDQPDTLEVSELVVAYDQPGRAATVVKGLSFSVRPGQTLGLVGESGSGKTVTSLALMGLIDPPGRVVSGSVRLAGRELIGLSAKEWSMVRGSQIAMIFQEPRRSLDPAFTAGQQIAEVARRSLALGRRGAAARAAELLEQVGFPDPSATMRRYPHQLSGGMCQRVILCMALAGQPRFLIADEPTTALDVTIQSQVLDLLCRVQAERDLGMVFVTHDLAVVAEMCDDVAVLFAGEIVEQAPAEVLFSAPRHPYTQTLLDSLPRMPRAGHTPEPAAGSTTLMPPAGGDGCRFADRCDFVESACLAGPPPVVPVGPGHSARCARTDDVRLRGLT